MFTFNQLKIFSSVAETGSFNKAAAEEYMTPNAVVKQINNLEDELTVQLLIRNHRGVELTEAGTSFYKDALKILALCDDSAQLARNIANKSTTPIRLGTSLTNPPDGMEQILIQIQKRNPDLKIELVPFENTLDTNTRIFSNIGAKIDMIFSTCDPNTQRLWNYETLEITRMPFYAVMSISNPLSAKEIITFDDLHGKNLMLTYEGYNHYLDNIRKHIKLNHPLINIVDTYGFDIDLYNRAANSNDIFIGIGNKINGHPFTRRILLDWDERSPYGIVYSKNPTPHVKSFISEIKEILNECGTI